MEDREKYRRSGFIIKENFFQKEIAHDLLEELQGYIHGSKKSFKNSNNDVRFCALSLSDSKKLKKISFDSRIHKLVSSLIDQPFYLYQIKVNPNNPFSSSNYLWHQDYYYWHHLDGMMSCNAVNIAILLEDVTINNGPTIFIPTSHQGNLCPHTQSTSLDRQDNLGKSLPYIVSHKWVSSNFDIKTSTPATGEAGTLIAFHPNILHKALDNKSDSNRMVLFFTFVSKSVPFEVRDKERPLWLANRNNQLNFPLFPDKRYEKN